MGGDPSPVTTVLRWAIRLGLRQGWRKGVLEGNRIWIVLGGAAVLGHLGARVVGGEPDVVFRELIRPGETFLVNHESPS